MPTAQRKTQAKGNGGGERFEAEYWRMADALRGSMDAAEYKHVVLGLVFLKYISDAFEERARRSCRPSVAQGADPEHRGRIPRAGTCSGCLRRGAVAQAFRPTRGSPPLAEAVDDCYGCRRAGE